MIKQNSRQITKLLSVLFSCEKYEQALTWLAWFERLKLDPEAKFNLIESAKKIIARNFPESEAKKWQEDSDLTSL